MKLENFEKVKALVKQINENEQILDALGSNEVSVRVMDDYRPIMTIGTWSSCEHECKDIAEKFRLELFVYFTSKSEKLTKELEML